MRTMKDILSSGSASIELLLVEAFEVGKAEGIAETRAKLLASTFWTADDQAPSATVLGSIPTEGETAGAGSGHPPTRDKIAIRPNGRAIPGTVKPEIARVIAASHSGITQDEIIEKTGFKSNSVRGTIYQLAKDKEIERRNGRYYPLAKSA